MLNLNVRVLRNEPLRGLELLAQLPGMSQLSTKQVLSLAKEIEMRQDLLADLERGLAQAITGKMLLECMPVSSYWLTVNHTGGLEIDIAAYAAATIAAEEDDTPPRDVLVAEVGRLMRDGIHGIVTPFLYPPLKKFLRLLEVPDYEPLYSGDTREGMLDASDEVYEGCAEARRAVEAPLIQEAVEGYIRHDLDPERYFDEVEGVSRQLYADDLARLEPFCCAIDTQAFDQAIGRMAARTVIGLDSPIREAIKSACRAKSTKLEPLDDKISRVTVSPGR